MFYNLTSLKELKFFCVSLRLSLCVRAQGLFARRRQLLLTEGPHLYYVDPVNKVLKGEIPWSPELRPEAKNFKTFFVHTVTAVPAVYYLITPHLHGLNQMFNDTALFPQPNRTYYLMDPSGNADKWCKKIQEVWRKIYHKHQSPSLQDYSAPPLWPCPHSSPTNHRTGKRPCRDASPAIYCLSVSSYISPITPRHFLCSDSVVSLAEGEIFTTKSSKAVVSMSCRQASRRKPLSHVQTKSFHQFNAMQVTNTLESCNLHLPVAEQVHTFSSFLARREHTLISLH